MAQRESARYKDDVEGEISGSSEPEQEQYDSEGDFEVRDRCWLHKALLAPRTCAPRFSMRGSAGDPRSGPRQDLTAFVCAGCCC